ncbi:MAG: ankyrin repeat domain-containing protein [Legionella longbeachae]|nr:ankyrin repeat domain-containing protein [Legionella longbeachae]
MTNKFYELCNKLRINSLQPTPQDVNKLIYWCESNISTDLHFGGELIDRFKSCQNIISKFLDTIQPNINTNNLTDSVSNLEGMTPLQVIVNLGLNVYLKKLQPSPEQINTKVNGITLIHLAAIRGHLHTIEDLLSLNANLDETNTNHGSILFSTLILPIDHDEQMKKNKHAIYILLSKFYKDISFERNESNDNILHIMSIYGYKELVKDMLKEAKNLASISNNLGRYPIHSAILNGQYECVQQLILVDDPLQLTDFKGRNALHYAAKYGNEKMVKICLSIIPIDSFDKQGQTPLMLAAIANNTVAVKELLDSHSQVNIVDYVGRSTLHYAVKSNNLRIVQLLLTSRDINVNICDSYSQNPLDLVEAKTLEGDEIRKWLLKKDALHSDVV